MTRLVALLLTPLFLFGWCDADASSGDQRYVGVKACESPGRVCSYSYSGLLTHRVDTEAANVLVGATLRVSCESSGEFARDKASKYCLDVTNGYVKYSGSNGETTKNLDSKLSAKKFCFIQTSNGTISMVLLSSDETPEIVNFKKAIVSGFQANFDGTPDVNELDPQSEHTSHYKYFDADKSTKHMRRTFDETDIAIPHLPKGLGYQKTEEVKYIDSVLYQTQGETHITIPKAEKPAEARIQTTKTQTATVNQVKEEIKQESMMNGNRIGRRSTRSGRNLFLQSASPRSALSIDYTYTLQQTSCSQEASRTRRENSQSQGTDTTSSLASTLGNGNDKYSDMLSSLLTKIQETLKEQSQVESLKELLSMESEQDSAAPPSVNNVKISSANTDNWDMAGSEYDSIASYSQRQADKSFYSTNAGYLWKKQLGTPEFNLQVESGMFSGADDEGENSKIFGKSVTKLNLFGHLFPAGEVEILREIKSGNIHKKVNVIAGSKNIFDDSNGFSDEVQLPTSTEKTEEFPLIEVDVELFVGVATVRTRMTVDAHLNTLFSVNRDTGVHKNTQTSIAFLRTSLTIGLHGSSEFSVASVKGGASIDGSLSYSLEFDGRVAHCVAKPPAFRVSNTIKDQWERGYLEVKPRSTVDCGAEGCDEAPEKDPESRREIPERGSKILFEKYQTFGEQTQCSLNRKVEEAKSQIWSKDLPVEANMGLGAHHTPQE